MSEAANVTEPRTPRTLSVAQPDWAVALSDSQRRASVNRHALEQQRRQQARQHALVTAWLRDLAAPASPERAVAAA